MLPVLFKFKLNYFSYRGVLVFGLLLIQQCVAFTYTDQFVIYVKGGRNVSENLAQKYGYTYLGEIIDGYHHLRQNKVTKRSIKTTFKESEKISDEPEVLLERQKRDARSRSALTDLFFNDPLWPKMWYLNRAGGNDMNIKRVWEQGITGRGVVVTILDDGIEKDHPDMFENYDPKASYDMNNNDFDPEPRYDQTDSNRHGTRCAGTVAATANNSHCAVGIAYGVSIGGIRMLDGPMTDAVEAKALSFNLQHIDIYSSSWGPNDNGCVVEGPGKLAAKAFKAAIDKGRNGLGSIFVWASGNGGPYGDNCNCDGYANSMWTITVAGASESERIPWYAEPCSSILATTYSSGSEFEKKVVTTDLHHKCTLNHTGTSAAAPIAAGVVALTLQANPKLTWRDIQHLVIKTSSRNNLIADDWKTNGVGRPVSHFFGYGLMDAAAMVSLGREWVTMPQRNECVVKAETDQNTIPAKGILSLSVPVYCEEVNYLEHVQSTISITAPKRGDLKIDLISSMGTKSQLLTIRPHDNSSSGFNDWSFSTVHSWEESPNGVWQLNVYNDNPNDGVLLNWTLVLFGTSVLLN